MHATFYRPDNSIITAGGTTNLACSTDFVKGAVAQAYTKVYAENPIEDHLRVPHPIFMESYDVELKAVNGDETSGEKYPVIAPHRHSLGIKFMTPECAGCVAMGLNQDCASCEKTDKISWATKVAHHAAHLINSFGKQKA